MTSVATLHRDVFGAPAVGVWSAPGRVNLIGEHTDYNDGLVLPIALPQRTYAACSPRGDRLLRVHSAQADETVEVDLDTVGAGSPSGWSAYVAGVLWALAQEGHVVRGMDVTVDSDVPLGAGLSSSAALECAVGAAASDLFGLGLLFDDASRARLARACVRAENEVAGANTGGMDQSAALLCRTDHALLLDCRSGETEHIPFDLAHATGAERREGTASGGAGGAASDGSEGAAFGGGEGAASVGRAGTASVGRAGTASDGGHVLLVTDTRAAHQLNDGQYAERRSASEQAARELGLTSLREVDPAELDASLARLSDDVIRRRAKHVVTEIERVRLAVTALRSGDLVEVGRLFDASHASLRDDYEVSCDELDVSVEAARSAGALGARMTGGGFGGSSIALLPADAVDAAEEAVGAAFADRGWDPPRSFVVTAGTAARRDA